MTAPTVAEAQLSTVLDTAQVGIIIVDAQGRILAFNKACERMFGYPAREILGTDSRPLLSSPGTGKRQAWFDVPRRRAGRRANSGRDVLGVHRDGTTIPFELEVGVAQTPDGCQYIAVLRDQRRRRKREQRFSVLQGDMLRMARSSAIDEMGAALAHELNQPLTALMLYLQAIERASSRPGADAGLSPVVADILDKSLREAERAGKIIQRMRNFVEKREPLRRLIDLAGFVDDAVELTLLGSRPGTRVTRRFAKDLPRVMVDPIQIRQVIVNLVRNAGEAVKDVVRPEVRITTSVVPGGIALTVSDNGPGIPPDVLPDLFKAFSTAGSGMGLGLTISKTIAQTHGGDLTVEPGGDGRGASFTLTLPLPAPSAD